MRVTHNSKAAMGLLIHAAAQHITGREEQNRRDIMSLFRNLFARRKSRAEFEHDYLCESVSRYDLEQREREVARGRFAGY